MAQLLGAAKPVQITDARWAQVQMRGAKYRLDVELGGSWIRPDQDRGYIWRRSSMLGELGVDVAILGPPGWFQPPPVHRGASARFGFNGYTRDAAGGVISGVTVKCFRTADDVKQSETTSGADGFFVVTTSEAGGHYLLFYKAGTPDISGTTVNTLVGS